MAFEYYYGKQADQYSFIKVPKLLVHDKAFIGLSVDAKMLYGLLLDRMSLSMKNGWLDEENRVYIIYQIKDIMSDMNMWTLSLSRPPNSSRLTVRQEESLSSPRSTIRKEKE